MQALKCDRCGKLYESYYLTDDLTKVDNDYKHYVIDVQKMPNHFSFYSFHLDLCKDCYKDLVEFIEDFSTQEKQEV